jgi:hypothetical protein
MYAKEAGLDDVVSLEMWRKVEDGLQDGRDTREVIGTLLCAQISAAIKLIEDSCGKKSDMEEIIKLLDKNTNSIRRKLLSLNKLQRPTPDKVFREVKQDGIFVLIPASNTIGIVLQHSLTKEPSLDELEEILKYAERCNAAGLNFMTCAFETTGAICMEVTP